ncbi:MAG: sigma-70 family RNA polymerase sigma factor [Planctomycetaceae bacterium]|nr:sigma-70 family RNA polymerase sigma factor [Planctomycetaceae bacterium]
MDRFEKYLEEYRRPIYSYVLRLVRDPHLAEDITQETFVRLYKEMDNIRDSTASAWIYRVARNLVTDYSRKKKPVLFTVLKGGMRPTDTADGRESVDFAGNQQQPPAESYENELQLLVAQAIERMSPKYRDPLILCDMEHLTYEQAADVLNCSVKTVSARLHRAREFLSTFLKKHAEAEN